MELMEIFLLQQPIVLPGTDVRYIAPNTLFRRPIMLLQGESHGNVHRKAHPIWVGMLFGTDRKGC